MPTKVFSTSGWAPYADRATAAAATVPAWIDAISYIGPSRDVLQFVEDADAATPALTTGDGRKWVPAGVATAEHYGIGAPAVASMLSDIGRGEFRHPLTLDDDLTIDGPITFRPGAYIDGGAGPTLTIRAPVMADRASWIFRGDYTLSLTHSGSDEGENARDVHAAWFGAFPGSLALGDQAPFIHRGFAAMGNGRESRMLFEIGNYNVNSIIDVTRGGLVQGAGRRRTVFKAMSDFGPAFQTIGDAVHFQDIQFEEHTGVDRAIHPWIALNTNGCVVRRSEVRDGPLGIVVNGLDAIVDEVGAAYENAFGAGSSVVLIQKGSAKASNIFRASGAAGPEAIVAVGTDAAGNIASVAISDVRFDSTSIGVFLDARDVSLNRLSVRDVLFTGSGAAPELVRLETGGANGMSSVVIDGVMGSGTEGRMVGIYQASSGTTRRVALSNVIASGSTGEGIRLEETAGTLDSVAISDNCDLGDKPSPLVRNGLIQRVRIGSASNVLGGTMPPVVYDINNLADGAVMTIPLGRPVFSARILVTSSGGNHGDFAVRAASGPSVTKISGTANVVGLASTPPGTGTNITICVTDGQIQVENRSGAVIRGTLVLMAGS